MYGVVDLYVLVSQKNEIISLLQYRESVTNQGRSQGGETWETQLNFCFQVQKDINNEKILQKLGAKLQHGDKT